VASCDDLPFAEFLIPSLSTVHVPLAETGEQAVDLLLRSIAGEPVPAAPVLLPVHLVVRASCGGVGLDRKGERESS
jgi:LacI family transcriptional regulator